MNSINLIFKNGHFYDKTTGERILFKDGREYHVVSSYEDSFSVASQAGTIIENPLSSKDLLLELIKEGKKDFHKILDEGTELFFEMTLAGNTYEFKALIKQDLYFSKPKEKGNDFYSLNNCYSVTVENTKGNLDYFETVTGKSLNDLYKCTYVHYNGNKGNPAANAITTFRLKDGTTLDSLRKKFLDSLKMDSSEKNG